MLCSSHGMKRSANNILFQVTRCGNKMFLRGSCGLISHQDSVFTRVNFVLHTPSNITLTRAVADK